MLSTVFTLTHLIDVVLIQPIAITVKALVTVIYYFFAVSVFVGYCLVEAGAHIWKVLCNGYQLAIVVVQECTLFYCELRQIICNIVDYIYEGTGDALNLARNVTEGVLLFLGNVLIGLGNCTLWILLLLPRTIIAIVDYIIIGLDHVGGYVVEHGVYLLNNVFRLSIGIAVLLVLYMFRIYVYLLAIYICKKIHYEISTKVGWALQWADQQLFWMFERFKISDSSVQTSVNPICCVVCLERNRNIVILPCRHLCLCKECSQQLHRFEGGQRCPVCRHYIDTLLPVFD